MSTLSVPGNKPAAVKRSGSANSLRHSADDENDLAPVTRASRRNSCSDTSTAAPTSIPTLPRPPTEHRTTTTTLYAGKNKKAFIFDTKELMHKSPYFKKLLAETPEPLAEQTTFEDADEGTMALFAHWVKGHELEGQTNWREQGQYLGLYCLAKRFECEALQNRVMDLTRTFYRAGDMTAAPYRLEYIYTYTHETNPMRRFLISTAAFRAISGPKEDAILSESMRNLIVLNSGDIGMDFIHALINLGREGEEGDVKDVRRGPNCN